MGWVTLTLRVEVALMWALPAKAQVAQRLGPIGPRLEPPLLRPIAGLARLAREPVALITRVGFCLRPTAVSVGLAAADLPRGEPWAAGLRERDDWPSSRALVVF